MSGYKSISRVYQDYGRALFSLVSFHLLVWALGLAKRLAAIACDGNRKRQINRSFFSSVWMPQFRLLLRNLRPKWRWQNCEHELELL